jgi:hypothetical protein
VVNQKHRVIDDVFREQARSYRDLRFPIKRRDCRENDLFALNANPEDFSIERLFSFDYVGCTTPGW